MLTQRCLKLLTVAAVFFAVAGQAQVSYTWTNIVGGFWTDSGSWSNVPPSGGQTNVVLVFRGMSAGVPTPTTYTSFNNFPGTFILNGLRVSTGTVTLAGGDLLFTNRAAGAAADDPFLSNHSGNPLVISNNIGVNAITFTIAATNDITLYGNFTTLAANTNVIKTGPGTLTLSGETTLAGNFSIAGGNVVNITSNLTVRGSIGFILSQLAGIAGQTAVVNQISGTVRVANDLRVGNIANTRS
ncbi:MAG: hypothetical protein N3B01_02710, partial [Verrucomicrobiae bacterium]|nr:hypothetical protein [Verrucomicrobiae bacterium]